MKVTILCVIAGLTLSGCEKDGDIGESALVGETTMTRAATVGKVSIRMWGSGTANVDWGDGNSQNVTLVSVHDIDHTYVTSDSRTIKISKAKVMGLICNDSQLTALDVSKNAMLTLLKCTNNQLTASALNALFITLPDNTESKFITISYNPGTDDCDKTIAEKKGWMVYDTGY